MRVIRLLLAMLVVVFVGLFALFGVARYLVSPSLARISTAYSPDNKMIAELVEVETGATLPFIYEVYVASNSFSLWGFVKEQRVVYLYDSRISECGEPGAQIAWASNDQLLIRYFDAKRVSNTVPAVEINGKRIAVTLVPHSNARSSGCR